MLAPLVLTHQQRWRVETEPRKQFVQLLSGVEVRQHLQLLESR